MKKKVSKDESQFDMDTAMLAGCMSFVLVSFIGYGICVWPWFIYRRADRIHDVAISALAGCLPAWLFGLVVGRRFGLAAAFGFFAGAFVSGVFMFLRLQQGQVEAEGRKGMIDYPASFIWQLPAAWILAALLVTLAVSIPKSRRFRQSSSDGD